VRSSMRFLKLWCQIALEWLLDVACALCWGGSRSTKPCVFPCEVAAGGDEGHLLCAAVAVWIVSACSATRGCESHCKGCMNVCVVLQNALQWQHECCMGLVLGRKPEHETVFFSV